MTLPADRPELPPQSRIFSRIDGSETTMVIPRTVRVEGGWVPRMLVTVFGFLSIVFTVQGINTQKPLWYIGGLFFFILAAGPIVAHIGPLMKPPGPIKLQISPQVLTVIAGSAEAPIKRHWLRSTISSVRAEPPNLNIYLNGRDTPVCLLSDLEPAELDWIADQIRVKWGQQED